jgi:hypothetical protein
MENSSPLANNVRLFRVIAAVSVLLHIVFVWLTSLGLRDGEPVIYWQKYNEYIFYFRFLTFLVFLGALWLSIERKHRNWASLIPLVGSCIVLSFVQFVVLFVASFVTHMGTVQLHGKTYQLASVAKYDDETAYYVGECERNSIVCTFYPIYYLYLSGKNPELKIKLIGNDRELVVELGNETVYVFDGVNVKCNDSYYGYCITDNFEE